MDDALVESARGAVTALLPFRFPVPLAEPAVPISPLLRAVAPDQIGRLLASCDRRTIVGRPDLAILTVLARLGLRAGEVAALKVDDLDWRAGEIEVPGKGNRRERLPLLPATPKRRLRDACCRRAAVGDQAGAAAPGCVLVLPSCDCD